MKIDLEPGKYIVAVSGGVDSMALLDVLCHHPGLDLIVAHFDHGIRPDSSQDCKLVESVAKEHDLMFESKQGKLGPSTSEEAARSARYDFLHTIREKHNAKSVITAHHKDDLLETVLINLLRGTGRKGLSSLNTAKHVTRPLLAYSKIDLIHYAEAHKLSWREDSTNTNTEYLRNYLRIKIVPRLTTQKREQLLSLVTDAKRLNLELDQEITSLLQLQNTDKQYLSKKLLLKVPHNAACEVVAAWLRKNDLGDFDRHAIERVVIAAKTFRPGQQVDVHNKKYVVIEKKWLVFTT